MSQHNAQSSSSQGGDSVAPMPMLLGHPTGLFTLFFAEMWERFSYYGMRALLIFYMTKGFLNYGDGRAYEVYGAYTALVYATPFIGGMLADRLLGSRKAVILGGMLMAAGHLLMTIENNYGFFGALGLLIVGNGFFKPNISTIVGTLYSKESKSKDSGFTIFYMGINLGAALAPLVCGYVGETYGWHYGFGLATIGMLIGLAVFVAPTIITQLLILGGSIAAAVGMFYSQRSDPLMLSVYAPVALVLLLAAIVAAMAVGRGGIPSHVGQPPEGRANKKAEFLVIGGSIAIVPVLGLMLYYSNIAKVGLSVFGALALGYIVFEALRSTRIERQRLFVVIVMMFFSMLFWAFFEQAGSSVNNFTDRNIARVNSGGESRTLGEADVGKPLTFTPNQAQLGYEWPVQEHTLHMQSTAKVGKLLVESGATVKAGDAVIEIMPVAEKDAPPAKAQTLTLKDLHPSLIEGTIVWNRAVGEVVDDPASKTDSLATFKGRRSFTLDQLDEMRDEHKKKVAAQEADKAGAASLGEGPTVTWTVDKSHVGMLVGGKEIPASVFQAVNPVCIMIFGLLFSAIWGGLGRRNLEPNTSIKFGLGLLQLGLGFIAFWWGVQTHDDRGMSSMAWLVIGYTLHTTGELCLSPVGLSMVTRLSPTRIVSMVMGGWFLATAFSNLLASMIAALTGVSHGADGGSGMPVPIETVNVYGDVFFKIGIAAGISAVMIFALSPILTKWEHRGEKSDADMGRGGH